MKLSLPQEDKPVPSSLRFADGARYRFEIPSTEGPESFKAVIYPSGRHMESMVINLSKERVRRTKLVHDLIKRKLPDAVISDTGKKHRDLHVPVY